MNVVVVGAGASGLVSAICLARKGIDVTILERNDRCGKKLLLTGNGRCNLYNSNQDISKYHSKNIEMFSLILKNHERVIPFFESLGVVLKDVEGYYYPYSNQSVSILNCLLNELNRLKVKILYNTLVNKIVKKEKFIIYTNNGNYEANKVVLAMGSCAYPKTGSVGMGYDIAKDFGCKVIKPLPSLVGVVGLDNFYKDWHGVRSEVCLTLYENGKEVKDSMGEVQFTNYGISGICTFNLSGLIARGLNKGYSETIKINFVPWFKKGPEKFKNFIEKRVLCSQNCTLVSFLEGFLNYKIANLIVKILGYDKDVKLACVNKDKLIELLFSFVFKVKSVKGFDEAQVCTGGVDLKEVNINTLESVRVKDLYFIGEMLDVDGDCGGYNLTFAWICGFIIGDSIQN